MSLLHLLALRGLEDDLREAGQNLTGEHFNIQVSCFEEWKEADKPAACAFAIHFPPQHCNLIQKLQAATT